MFRALPDPLTAGRFLHSAGIAELEEALTEGPMGAGGPAPTPVPAPAPAESWLDLFDPEPSSGGPGPALCPVPGGGWPETA